MKNLKKVVEIFYFVVHATTTQIMLESIYKKVPNEVFFILQILFMIYVINGIIKSIRIISIRKKFMSVKMENERLEGCYDDIRSFRHDFSNIMQAMGGYILIRDWRGLEKIYDGINNETTELKNCLGISSQNINNPAVYNLINNKYCFASKYNIKMYVDVQIDLSNLNISDFNLCRILGILIDNAIEATKECEEKRIIVKFVYDTLNKRNLIIIENPYNNKYVDLKNMYIKGFTSKKDKKDHGLGLWKVKQIINLNKNLQLYTNANKLFKQQLEIY